MTRALPAPTPGLPVNPFISTIVAELSSDGKDVVMVAVGPSHAVGKAMGRINLMTPAFRPSEPRGCILAPLSWPLIVQMASTFGGLWQPQPRLTQWIYAQVVARVDWAKRPLAYKPPAGLIPYPWQLEAQMRIGSAGGLFIMDDPGTGKTVSAILGIAERYTQYGAAVLPVVIGTPAGVVDPFVEEFGKWAPHLTVCAYRGTKDKRRKLVASKYHVYVASWDTIRADAAPGVKEPLLMKLRPRIVVADESHFMKTPLAVRTLAMCALGAQADIFVPMSGTPISHDARDLHDPLRILEPGAYPDRERFTDRYVEIVPGDYGKGEAVGLRPDREPEFRTSLRMRRVAKADALPFLPKKVYSVREVEMPQPWRKVYDDMEAQMLAEMPTGEHLSVTSVLARLTRLAQLSSAAADVETLSELQPDGDWKEKIKVTLRLPSWKVDALMDIMTERPGKPILCFSPSKQLMALAARVAIERGYRVGHIWGGQTQRERTAMRHSFQAGQLDLIVVTVRSGGAGLTLTAAGTVVYLGRPWSLTESSQSEDRAHRIGSELLHDHIEIIDVLCKNTIDARYRAVLRNKAGHLGELFGDPRIVRELLGGKPIRELVKVVQKELMSA